MEDINGNYTLTSHTENGAHFDYPPLYNEIAICLKLDGKKGDKKETKSKFN